MGGLEFRKWSELHALVAIALIGRVMVHKNVAAARTQKPSPSAFTSIIPGRPRSTESPSTE
jgi:hypothetical protein